MGVCASLAACLCFLVCLCLLCFEANKYDDDDDDDDDEGSVTFRIPLLFPGLRRYVYLVRRGVGRRAELMYVTTIDCR